MYEQAPNTWNEPAAGSDSVPTKDPAALIVPWSSIAAEDPVDANMKRSVDPLARATVPLNGRTRVVGGFCQELVEVTREPSESTSMCAVRTWPLASDPPVHASALVRCTVKDQFPAAWAAVRPPPPGVPMSVSMLVSQAARDTSNVRQRAVDLT